ncbi:unnamed protein product [Psylliodes chrysocephalus]|uniref:GIY-YIG domain-containing protein n=1 Tax=Psylliodes chrysocephalus TaxID=3402493 RepID=A0A9P0DER4_9CUCU|nr:unnamed protein product [Psylliodes chrysocephala]
MPYVFRKHRATAKLKDKVPITSLSDVVYSIPCGTCHKSYIGQTSRCLKDRITSHRSDSRLHPKCCALAEHVHKNDHIMDYENVTILERETNISKRQFLEISHIYQHDNSINKRSDIKHLSEIFSYLLYLDKHRDVDNQFANSLLFYVLVMNRISGSNDKDEGPSQTVLDEDGGSSSASNFPERLDDD